MQPFQTSPARETDTDVAEGRTILMVEDDASVMDVGTAILNDCGYAVVSVGSADEAMQKVQDGLTFDLLFCDIVMPGEMNGVALAGEIRRLMPQAPILLTSGWADRALEHHGEGQGYAFIGKPYRHADLARKIQLLFDGPDEESGTTIANSR